jgi:hypothetical protein
MDMPSYQLSCILANLALPPVANRFRPFSPVTNTFLKLVPFGAN